MSKAELQAVLGRPEREFEYYSPPAGKILVTGANGSIGSAVVRALRLRQLDIVPTDVDNLDVADANDVRRGMLTHTPKVIFHMAGAKHAPEGEHDPVEVTRVNVIGTENVLRHAPQDAVVVVASTCKACNPETAYGASKLIAERLTLNAKQRVVRYYNVAQSSGNVFEIWNNLPQGAALPTANCRRYFISLDEAVHLTIAAASLPCGRYSVNPGGQREIPAIAKALYPDRAIELIPPRRGDRMAEPRFASHEKSYELSSPRSWIEEVFSPNDLKGDA
jgi:FlaA1/EpsC-like NDP-sugar epimerase